MTGLLLGVHATIVSGHISIVRVGLAFGDYQFVAKAFFHTQSNQAIIHSIEEFNQSQGKCESMNG